MNKFACKEKHSDLKSYSGPYCFKGLGGSCGFHVRGSCDVQNNSIYSCAEVFLCEGLLGNFALCLPYPNPTFVL